MKFGPFQIFIAPRAGGVDTARPGWRQRMGDMVLAARGKAGLKTGTGRATPEQLAEYYGLLPKLTLPQIRGLLNDWMAGNWTAGYDLVSLMLDTWPVALKNQHECRSVVRRTPFLATAYRVGAAEPTKSAEQKAAFVNHCLENFAPTPGTDERGWGGTLYGVAGALVLPTIRESLWTRDGSDWRPYATAWAHPRTYGTTQETLPDGRQVTRLAARIGDNHGLPMLGYRTGAEAQWLDLRRSIIGIYDTRDGACTMAGLFRPLAFWWGGMMYGREWLLRYAEMFGQPLRIAYYGQAISAGDLATLKTMLGNMGASAWAALPEEVRKLDVIEAKGTGADNPQRFMIEHGDKYCDLLFKGETSQGGNYSGGQREQADFRQASRTSRDENYTDWAAETVREQLVREIIRANWGTEDEVPFLIPDYTVKPGRKEQAEIVQTWLNNYDLDPEDAAEISGLPLRERTKPPLTALAWNSPAFSGQEPPSQPPPQLRARRLLRAAASTSTSTSTNTSKNRELLAAAMAEDLAPVRARLETILALDDDATLLAELKALQSELPTLLPQNPAAAAAMEKAIGTALVEGLTEKETTA